MPLTEGERTVHLGPYQARVDAVLREMTDHRIVTRLWEQDSTLWQPELTDISTRLGWLQLARTLRDDSERMHQFIQDVRVEGYTQGLVLGMGGASLAPALFCHPYGADQSPLSLAVLDSTAPGAVRRRQWTPTSGRSSAPFSVSSRSQGATK